MKLLCGVIDNPKHDLKIRGITEFRSLYMFGEDHLMSTDANLLLKQAEHRGDYIVMIEPGYHFTHKKVIESWASASNVLCMGQEGITLIHLKKWVQQNKPSWDQLLSTKIHVDLLDKVVLFNNLDCIEYANQYSNRIWHVNTEQIQSALPTNRNINCIVIPTAGLKAITAARHFKCPSNSEIVFFDYSKLSLDFKQNLILNWDGIDYPKYVRANPTNGVLEDVANYSLHSYWKSVLKWFKGSAAFIEQWKLFCSFKHSFIHCNLLDESNQDMLFNTMTDKNVAVFTSNIFFTPYAYHTAPPPAVNQLSERWFALLKSHPSLIVDHNCYTSRHGYFM